MESRYSPLLERVWATGLLLVSVVVVPVVALAACWCRCSAAALFAEVMLGVPAPGLVAVAVAADQELQVSQPSAERVDMRQQDQRLPLQKPAWYLPLRPGFSLHTGSRGRQITSSSGRSSFRRWCGPEILNQNLCPSRASGGSAGRA